MTRAAEIGLLSLAPRYIEAQHQTYLNRLEEVVVDPKNLNIALTGRYGAGKSSVLEKFEATHPGRTRRMAISTLGPNDEGASLTNRIQKELVKQLLYSADPQTLRHSRFSRTSPITKRRAVIESASAVVLIGAILGAVGWLPSVALTGSSYPLLVRTIAWVVFGILVTAVLAALRLITHNRFFLSDVSAAGASVKLTEKSGTYFDEYLDQIVHYFDTESPDVIIFEDLDRFNDPHIFESLRELNTLLNNTPKRRGKRRPDRTKEPRKRTKGSPDDGANPGRAPKPLRFVYAVRDSLFEQLGTDTGKRTDDAAAAETVRANRTKFFDIVIPLVPFISHRTARELLTSLLAEAEITGIDRPLISVVAQHVTDMRLMRNIRNEYLVFAERLLESDRTAPGLTPSKLFALVTYKNFHLEDFENIARRSSDLDALYDFRRDLVRDSVASLEQRKRDLASAKTRARTRAGLAAQLGQTLRGCAEILKRNSGYAQWPPLNYQVNEKEFTNDQVETYEFWQAVAAAGTIALLVNSADAPSGQRLATIERNQLTILVPEGMESQRWTEYDQNAAAAETERIDQQIAVLRGADFAELADSPQFTLWLAPSAPLEADTAGEFYKTREPDPKPSRRSLKPPAGSQTSSEPEKFEYTFGELVAQTIRSDLARALVRRGYIDRNFALYAAQFYGHFTGVDVATFMVQSVQTNTMDVDYTFTSPGAIANLLEEANPDFTHTNAAYNIQVLDHLLGIDDDRVVHVVTHMITNYDDNARTFLTSYLTSGRYQTRLAARLSEHPWRSTFTYLIGNQGVPDDARPALVNAALLAADPNCDYSFSDRVGQFLIDHYRTMQAFTKPQELATREVIVRLLNGVNVQIPDLEPLDPDLLSLVTEHSLFDLTADNLRVALGITGEITFDRILDNLTVYRYCLNSPSGYLAAVDQDPKTQFTITAAATLAGVINDVAAPSEEGQVKPWSAELIMELLDASAPTSVLPDLTEAATPTWSMLADARRFTPSVPNIEAYRAELGIDRHLAELLLEAGAIDMTSGEEPDEATKAETAVVLLNADAISDPAERVALVKSLDLDGPLPIGNIRAEPNPLFAHLLEHDLVVDDAATFKHFQPAGWPAIGPAIAVSQNIGSFLKPALVTGMVTELLTDQETSTKLGLKVVEALDDYVPDADGTALGAAARYAGRHGMHLKPATVLRIASQANVDHGLVLNLLQEATPPATSAEIVGVFSELGGDYSQIAKRDATFDLPRDDIHEKLLQVLQAAGICTFHKKRLRERFEVKVL